MYEFFDQIIFKIGNVIIAVLTWLISLFATPPAWLPAVVWFVFKVVLIIATFPAIFAMTTWAERKILGRIQNRLGPNRVGPVGLFQPIADGIKTLTKEDIVPAIADKPIHTMAPVIAVVASFLVIAVLPIGRNMIGADLNIGVLFFFAAGSISEVSIFMAGWASRNKYSLLGGMRAIAQMVSYEIPFILSAVTVVMVVGSLSTSQIVSAQQLHLLVEDPEGLGDLLKRVVFHFYNNIGGWFVFQPWGFFGFVIFFTSSLAELNRSPFDLPEAESEIIAGHHTEYSGFKFALFALSEYISMIAVCGLASTLFLGGWNGPHLLPSWGWFFLKVFSLMFVMIWIRGTFPRLRADQLMGFAWKFLLPLSLINIFSAGLWYHIPSRAFGWLASALIMGGAYHFLSRGVVTRDIEKRIYRFA